jgi:hypothetical protein
MSGGCYSPNCNSSSSSLARDSYMNVIASQDSSALSLVVPITTTLVALGPGKPPVSFSPAILSTPTNNALKSVEILKILRGDHLAPDEQSLDGTHDQNRYVFSEDDIISLYTPCI